MNKYINLGEHFLQECVFDGLAHSWDVEKATYVKAYPEVTGYVLKYFGEYADCLDRRFIEAADYLVKIQNKKVGGFYSFDREDILYGFDTAQILRGLLAVYERTNNEKYLDSAKLAGEFLISSQEECGMFKPYYNCKAEGWVIRDETYKIWNGPSSGLMCKIIEALKDMLVVTDNLRYRDAIDKAVGYYENAEYIEYSHPLGYWMEGMLAAGKIDKVKKIIEDKIIKRICENGFISYTSKVPYAYVSGTIQLGIILYKLGYREEAKKIRNYGRIVQANDVSGGLFQYANFDGTQNKNVHSEINSWGTKYFCELERLFL